MLFQSINKIKRSSVIMSMILIAVGLAMVICPERYIDTLVSSMGYLALILAVVMILLHWPGDFHGQKDAQEEIISHEKAQ